MPMPGATHFSRSLSRRNLLLGSLAATLTAGCATARRAASPTVLFVCEFGTAKSAISRELFRRRARDRRIAVTTFSRGLKIEDHVSSLLRQRLAAEGINPAADTPKVLGPRDWRRAEIVIAFNPLPPEVPAAKVRDWTDLPSINDDYARTRAMLDQRLEALLDEIAARAAA